MHVHDDERTATSATGRKRQRDNGSEYLKVALRWEARCGFVNALSNKRSETIREVMVDVQLLLRGVWRFHSDEGQELMGAVDDWLGEHAVLHTTTGAYDRNANSLVEETRIQSPCKGFLLVGTGGCLTTSKLRPSAMTERWNR